MAAVNRFRLALLACLLCATAATANAAEPSITAMNVRGLTSGDTVTLELRGANLLPAPKLLLDVPIAAQRVHDGAKANLVQIDVTLDATVPTGYHLLWLATSQGVSAPQAIVIDELPEQAFAPTIERLPVALTGDCRGSSVLRTTLAGKAGQRLVAEIESRRLGAMLKPVLHLYDARGVQVAWAQGCETLLDDCRLVAMLPADGQYTLELHDAIYRGAAPGHFRLKVGDLAFVDLAFPLAVERGSTVPLELIPQPSIQAAASTLPGQHPLPMRPLTGAAPRLIYSDLTEVVEQPPTDGALQSLTAPAAINGRLSKPGEEDQYRVAVKPGMKLRFDLMARRAGSPLDAVLVLRDEQGKQLATSDDQRDTLDPMLDYTAPQGVEAVVVSIKDLTEQGGEYYVYRVQISPLGQPDFELTAQADRVALPTASSVVYRVRATRRGYNGPIQLAVQGLPGSAEASNVEIPAGATDALLMLSATETAEPQVVRIVGQSVGAQPVIRREALPVAGPTTEYQPWLRRLVAAHVTDPLPLSVAWEPRSGEKNLPLGSQLPVNVTVARGAAATGPIRLTLLTSQIMPRKAVRGKDKRGRPGPEQQVDDPDRALRLDRAVTLKPKESATELGVLVPGDLPKLPYDLAVQADLLSADGKTVLATAYTSVWRLETRQPFSVQLAEAQVEAKAGGGQTGVLRGRIVRDEQFKLPVSVTLAGLPEQLPVPRVEVPADKQEFELPVAFPYSAAPGALRGVRVVGESQVSEGVTVRSSGQPVAVTVVRGDPPPALLPLFEDEAQFVAYLDEGDGDATLETKDRYCGTAALKATPATAQRLKMPGLGWRIAENPGPGEYRYIRFAWKKTDGVAVVLQLISSDYKPQERVVTRPAIAYEAGHGSNRLRIPSTRVSEKLPEDWVVVTRDLFADFGEFTLEGFNFVPGDGTMALYDHIYLAQSESDLAGCPEPIKPAKEVAAAKQ